MRSEEKLGHTNLNPEIIYLYIIDLIRNDWKHILRNDWKQHTSSWRDKLMNYELFWWYGDRRKAFSLISSQGHCQRSSPSGISDTPRAGFQPAQNLSSGFVECSCAVVMTTIPRHYWTDKQKYFYVLEMELLKNFLSTSSFNLMTLNTSNLIP